MPKQFVFVDFDNTLMGTEAHSLPSLIARFNKCYKQQLTLEEFKQHFHGMARESLCEKLGQHFSITVDPKTLYQNRETNMSQYYQTLQGGVKMAPFAIETLKSLAANGAVLSLVTNNPLQRAFSAMRYAHNRQGSILAALFGDRFFEAVDVQKPAPDVYLRAIQQVKADLQHSVAIEDSVTGVQAARAAGLKTVGYTGFADDPAALGEKLMAAGCVAVSGDWREIAAQLFR